MAGSPPLRNGAFVSYSHKDRQHLERLMTFLRPLMRDGMLKVWDDTQIKLGDNWMEEIEKAISSARVAVLLMSEFFMASDFIEKVELPKLLAAAKNEGARIFIIHLSFSLFKYFPLSQFQSINPPDMPLSKMRRKSDRDEIWVKLAALTYEELTRTPASQTEDASASKSIHSELPLVEEGPSASRIGSLEEDIPSSLPIHSELPLDEEDSSSSSPYRGLLGLTEDQLLGDN